MEGVADSFYAQVKVGHRIIKGKWDRYALLNGRYVEIVDVIFWPIPMFCFLKRYQKQKYSNSGPKEP